ncbi:hypothetical protein BUALT_Bualt17G0010000 [Buddleja alternifolia]|nr:hypothetical protein BUALT_Bualt17G0010000 [Buddleja alternifolia]
MVKEGGKKTISLLTNGLILSEERPREGNERATAATEVSTAIESVGGAELSEVDIFRMAFCCSLSCLKLIPRLTNSPVTLRLLAPPCLSQTGERMAIKCIVFCQRRKASNMLHTCKFPSSLVRPLRVGSSLYGLSSSFLGHQLEVVPDAGLQQWYGSHRFFSLRICLFVACGLGCSVRPSLWACQVNLLGRTLQNHKNLQKRINRRRVVVTGFGCSDSTRLGMTSGCSWEGAGLAYATARDKDLNTFAYLKATATALRSKEDCSSPLYLTRTRRLFLRLLHSATRPKPLATVPVTSNLLCSACFLEDRCTGKSSQIELTLVGTLNERKVNIRHIVKSLLFVLPAPLDHAVNRPIGTEMTDSPYVPFLKSKEMTCRDRGSPPVRVVAPCLAPIERRNLAALQLLSFPSLLLEAIDKEKVCDKERFSNLKKPLYMSFSSAYLLLVRFDGFAACFLIAAAATTPYLSGLGGCISLNPHWISATDDFSWALSKFPLPLFWVAPSLTPLVELRKPIPTSHRLDCQNRLANKLASCPCTRKSKQRQRHHHQQSRPRQRRVEQKRGRQKNGRNRGRYGWSCLYLNFFCRDWVGVFVYRTEACVAYAKQAEIEKNALDGCPGIEKEGRFQRRKAMGRYPKGREINRDPVSSGERERIGGLKKNKDEASFLSKVFTYFSPAERSVNRGRFLVTRPGDIRSENADMSNDKSCEKHDRLPVEGFLRSADDSQELLSTESFGTSMSTHHILGLKKVPRGELRGANPSTRGLGWANLWSTGCYANSSAGQLSWYGRTAAQREILLYTSSRTRFLNRTSIGERCYSPEELWTKKRPRDELLADFVLPVKHSFFYEVPGHRYRVRVPGIGINYLSHTSLSRPADTTNCLKAEMKPSLQILSDLLKEPYVDVTASGCGVEPQKDFQSLSKREMNTPNGTLVRHRRLKVEWSEGILLGEARQLTILREERGCYLTVVGQVAQPDSCSSSSAAKALSSCFRSGHEATGLICGRETEVRGNLLYSVLIDLLLFYTSSSGGIGFLDKMDARSLGMQRALFMRAGLRGLLVFLFSWGRLAHLQVESVLGQLIIGGVSGQHTKNEVVRSAGVGKRASVQLSLLSEVRYKAPFRSLLCVCWLERKFALFVWNLSLGMRFETPLFPLSLHAAGLSIADDFPKVDAPWDHKEDSPCACYCSKAFNNELDGMLSTCCDERRNNWAKWGMATRSGERLYARKNILPTLTLKSELEAMRKESFSFFSSIEKLHFTNTQSRLSVIEIMHIEGVKKIIEKEVSHSISKPSNPPVLGQDLLQIGLRPLKSLTCLPASPNSGKVLKSLLFEERFSSLFPQPFYLTSSVFDFDMIFERGIQVVDLLAPYRRGGKIGLFGGVGERTREGNDLYMEMKESGVINQENIAESKVALVYGQMNEPPGARMRVGLTALTMAEYFRDVNEQDVLLFIDNIFRFVQAGSEVSALLGRMPSAVACYMGREWELSFRLGMRPWIAVAYSAPVAAATAVFLIYPIGQGSFSDGMPLGISGTFNFMIVFQAEHNILMHPFHMLGVAGVFGGSLFSAMHGSLVTSSLIRETTENESANEGYRFGQEEETYNIVAAHGYFGRLIFQYASFNNSRSLHFFLAAWPVVGIWFTALGISTMAFNLNGFNFNQSVVDSQGRVINTWADIINRANLGMEVMHERNAHNFPLDLAAIEAPING